MLLTGRQEREVKLRPHLVAIALCSALVQTPSPDGQSMAQHGSAYRCFHRSAAPQPTETRTGEHELPPEHTCRDTCAASWETLLSEGQGGAPALLFAYRQNKLES